MARPLYKLKNKQTSLRNIWAAATISPPKNEWPQNNNKQKTAFLSLP